MELQRNVATILTVRTDVCSNIVVMVVGDSGNMRPFITKSWVPLQLRADGDSLIDLSVVRSSGPLPALHTISLNPSTFLLLLPPPEFRIFPLKPIHYRIFLLEVPAVEKL